MFLITILDIKSKYPVKIVNIGTKKGINLLIEVWRTLRGTLIESILTLPSV